MVQLFWIIYCYYNFFCIFKVSIFKNFFFYCITKYNWFIIFYTFIVRIYVIFNDYIEFTFKKRHHFKWNKEQRTCQVYWKNYKVDLNFNDPSKSEAYLGETKIETIEAEELIKKATDYFNNDSFWLVAPYKVFDAGTKRSLVTLDNGKHALLITYTSGGSTPGDSYLWLLDDSGKPTSFKMWTSILPIDGLEATWSDWKTTETGAMLPTFHKMMVLGLEIEDIKTK